MRKYTFADYAFQFVTVTAGVLIALLIDGLVDWNHNRELVATARQMIAREVAGNLKELEGLPKFISPLTRISPTASSSPTTCCQRARAIFIRST